MKRILFPMILIFFTTSLMAQGEVVTKYFEQFRNNEDFIKVSVSSKMFSLFTELEAGSDEEKEFLEAASKLKGIKMVISDSVKTAKTLFDGALRDVEKAGFEELMTVLDAEENFRFSIKEKGGVITELIMVAGGKKRFVLISIFGEIDLKNISKIARTMNIKGLNELDKLNTGEE